MKSINLLSYLLKLTLIVSVILGLASCASTQEELDPSAEFSGYLGDYSKLVENDDDDSQFLWVSKNLKKGKYTSIMLEKVSIYPRNLLKDNPNADLVKATAKHLDKGFYESLSKEFKMVNKTGPNTLRIRVALTHNKTDTLGMTGWEIVPIGAIIGGVQAATGTRAQIVQVVLEVEILDSLSNKRLGAAVRKATATQEERTKITQKDFMVLVHEFSAESGKNLAKFLK